MLMMRTAMMLAADSSHKACIKALIAHGAEVKRLGEDQLSNIQHVLMDMAQTARVHGMLSQAIAHNIHGMTSLSGHKRPRS